MNIAGMPVKPVMQAQKPTRTKIPDELSNVFQGILQKNKQPNAIVGNDSKQLEVQNPKELLKELLDSLPKEVEEQLAKLLKETDNLDQTLKDMNLSTDILQQLKELLGKLTKSTTSEPIQMNATGEDILLQLEKLLSKETKSNKSNQFQVDTTDITPNLNTTVVPINKKAIQQQLVEISKKAESLLSGIADQKSIAKVAPEIQKLLEQWSSLEKKLVGTKDSTIPPGNPDTAKSTKAESIWRELVSAYQKRDQFVNAQRYSTNAKVTSTDVEKWIGKALSKQSVSDNVLPNQVGASSLPISKVEQYVIHLNQTQNTQSSAQQLVDKFQEVMNSSKFLTINNGTTQLSITMRPANLGDIMVKLTQINGEMTVKIIVASAAAQNMLESNMNQLKHMFSPQQVVIEKQDINVQQAQNVQQENEQQSMNQQDQDQSEQPNQDQQKHSTDDYEKQFHEILMNEKV